MKSTLDYPIQVHIKNALLTVLFLSYTFLLNAQDNTLLSADFWRSSPTLESVKSEIAKGNNPSEQNAGFFDPVVMAINNNASNDVIIFLINQDGNDVHKKTHHSRTYLQWAAARGNLELVNFLIKNGADINYKDSYGESIIAYAAGSNKNIDVFEALFNAGVLPKDKHSNGATLIMYAAPNDTNLAITDYFISKGVAIDEKDDFNRTVTDYATKLGNIEIVDQFIKRGVPITDQAQFFATIGSRQKQNGLELYTTLLDKYKLNPNVVNNEGENLLHVLARRQNIEVFNYYLDKGLDPSVVANNGNTILMMASSGRDASIVKSLLEKVNNINAVNENNESALIKAMESGTSEIADLLIKNGADVNVKDKEGNNLVYYWFNSFRPLRGPSNPRGGNNQKNEFEEKLVILQNAGIDVTSPQLDGRNILHMAVDKGNIALINKAIELGVNINEQDQEGNTALHKAALIAKDDEILKLLVEKGVDKGLKTEFDETAYELASQNDFLKNNKISIDFLKQ